METGTNLWFGGQISAGEEVAPLQSRPPSSVHAEEQPSPFMVFPSSHSSPGSRTPLPHRCSTRQSCEHPSPFIVFPSSHSSSGSCTPSPQRCSAGMSLVWALLVSSHSFCVLTSPPASSATTVTVPLWLRHSPVTTSATS